MKVRHLYTNRRIVIVVLFAVLAILLLTAATSEAAPEQSCGFYHQVQRGQTLSEISRYYGVSVPALMHANPQIANPNRIYAGSWIYIPCGGGQGGRCSHVHYVQYGQTLSQIARYYHVHPYAIMRANGLHNPNLIYAGTSLCIP
jgi:spore germination protein